MLSAPVPPTFFNFGWTMVTLGAGLVGCAQSGGGFGRMRQPDDTVNVGRVSGGFGCLAVAALVLHAAAKDMGGVTPLLRFLIQVFSIYDRLPLLVLLGLAVLALLLVIGSFLICAGLAGPFPPRKISAAGGDALSLAVFAGAWLWGLFLPASWDLGGFGRGVNLGLETLYVFAIVTNAISIFLLVIRPMPPVRLPSPQELGLPMSGPASAADAHERLNRKGAQKPQKFYDS